MEFSIFKATNIVVKSTFNLLKEAHNLSAEHKVKESIFTIDSEVEYLSVEKSKDVSFRIMQ